LVKDIHPGGYASYPSSLAGVGGTLFFAARDGIHGDELWKSDGTKVGTALVRDIHPGINHYAPSDLTGVGGRLFFSADDGIHGQELWRSDGTRAGTVLVKDINAVCAFGIALQGTPKTGTGTVRLKVSGAEGGRPVVTPAEGPPVQSSVKDVSSTGTR
jgi:ELWxxDGT repeat protein